MYRKACTTIAAAAVLLSGAAACTDLTVEPRGTAATAFDDPGTYRALLARVYAGLSVTGQQGAAGQGDIRGIDEGFSQYVRLLWQMQQLPTEEAVLGWGDGNILQLNRQDWTPANEFLTAMYYRIFFQVGMANEFLRETTEERLAGRNLSPALRTEIQQNRAEARFLRALSYWHGIDLFGSVPLITEAAPAVGPPPAQATRQQLYEFVVGELTTIRPQLPATPQYGRAGQAAVDMLLAKLYLNSAVYTGTARWSDARAAAERVIADADYRLASSYIHNFLADNHTSPEIIFPVTFDGERTRTWGGTTFLVAAAIGNQMNSRNYGTNEAWWGLRTTPEFVDLFPSVTGPDQRAEIIFTTGQQREITELTNFAHGYAVPKYRNVTRAGNAGSHPQFPDTDFPMFRLADAYLMYAEAVVRGGGGSMGQAVNYVNEIRRRAYGGQAGDITQAQLTLDFILAERARELFWEGHRRTDLVRFGRFTTGDYHWSWKGGQRVGRATDACRNLYPLPASELAANANLQQHQCYQ